MSTRAGITGVGRDELAAVVGRGRRLVGVDDVMNALHTDRREAATKLARWAARGWLRRVRRGLYIPVPVDAENPATWSEDPLYIADAVWSPCYFTGWTSVGHWGLTEQVFRTTVLKTSGRVRASIQTLLDHEYLVAHCAPDDLSWGMKTEWRGDRRLHMADPARTVVDILDDPRLGGGIRHGAEIVSTYLAEREPADLISYGDRLGNGAVFKRLGYIASTFDVGSPDLIEKCKSRISAGISLLDPGGPDEGRRVTTWGLRVNVRLGVPDAS